MSDAQIITWIAEHFVRFRAGIHTAYLDYIDEEGCEVKVSVDFPDENEKSCEELLRACIKKVTNK